MANSIVISGNLVRDPEVVTLKSGTQKGIIRMINNRRYKTKDGEKKEDSTAVDVEFWGGIVNTLQYINKGSGVIVSGRLRESQWEDKDSGKKRSKLVIVGEDLDFMPKKSGDSKPAKEDDNEEIF